jgi:hypothetical protein
LLLCVALLAASAFALGPSRDGASFNVPQRTRLQAKESLDLTPLSDMAAEDRYKGEDGGLYGAGRGRPSEKDLRAALQEAARVRPLDADGKPSQDGKIVLLSNGMSNTTQEFQAFMRLATQSLGKSPQVILVDGAQGGMEALDWAHPERRFLKDRPSPWEVLDQRLRQARVTRAGASRVDQAGAARPGVAGRVPDARRGPEG